jgi:hypothetical protein
MNYEIIFRLAQPYLKKNDFGMSHTRRVFEIAKKNFEIPRDLEDLIFCSIILHDIGGNTIEKQYKDGPTIAATILEKLGCDENFIQNVCTIVQTHHEHPSTASLAFRILYDSDKLVMFSPEEFSHYDIKPNFDWNQIINQIYHKHARRLAEKLLEKRRSEYE